MRALIQFNKLSSTATSQIRRDRWARHKARGEMRNAKLEYKRPFGRSRCGWEDNIKNAYQGNRLIDIRVFTSQEHPISITGLVVCQIFYKHNRPFSQCGRRHIIILVVMMWTSCLNTHTVVLRVSSCAQNMFILRSDTWQKDVTRHVKAL